MKLLLDTHILIWFAVDRPRLLSRERELLADDSADLFASAISLWEIRAKNRSERRRNKPLLTLDPRGAINFCSRAEIGVEPLAIEHYLEPQLDIDPEHGDMFDEMLLIHAQRLGAKLLTRDPKLQSHPIAFKF